MTVRGRTGRCYSSSRMMESLMKRREGGMDRRPSRRMREPVARRRSTEIRRWRGSCERREWHEFSAAPERLSGTVDEDGWADPGRLSGTVDEDGWADPGRLSGMVDEDGWADPERLPGTADDDGRLMATRTSKGRPSTVRRPSITVSVRTSSSVRVSSDTTDDTAQSR